MYTLKAHEESMGSHTPVVSNNWRTQRQTELGLSTRVNGNNRRGRTSPALSITSSSTYSTLSSVDYHLRSSSPPSSSSSSQTSETASRHISLPSLSLLTRSPAVNSPTTYAPYTTTSKYCQFNQCSTTLAAVIISSLLATSFLSQFPAGSEAQAINIDSTGGGNGLQHLLAGASLGGQWDLIGHSGVSAMHAILRPFTESVLFLERVQSSTFAKAQGSSAKGGNGGEKFAWSTEFSPNEGEWRSLDVKSNMFCSAGGYLPDGTVVSVAGGQPSDSIEQGYDGIRLYRPCNGTRCDWQQDFDVHLQEKRWYPTVESLATGELFILGGSNHAASVNNDHINVPNFELFPPLPGNQKTIDFPFLVETLPNNLYPIVHLLPDKNLFILASTKAIILNTSTWKIITRLPDIPGPPRNYPLTGGSVLLPLLPENNFEPEILVCGGATEFSTQAKGVSSCGRIAPLSKNPTWEMEDMPLARMMPDMAHLADGTIAILNGADTGTAGFGRASDPVLNPVQYIPHAPPGRRFRVWNPSVIARMYHSVAFMLPDMSLLVAGSNPNGKPVNYGEGEFPTEYRVERFSPPYLFPQQHQEPQEAIVVQQDASTLAQSKAAAPAVAQAEIVGWPTLIKYGEAFDLELQWFNRYPDQIQVSLVQPGFITHSTHMSQRFVGLEVIKRGPKVVATESSDSTTSDSDSGLVRVKAPATNGLAPPSHYMIVVVVDGVPVVEAKWVQLST